MIQAIINKFRKSKFNNVETLEEAKIRCGSDHQFDNVDFDLHRNVTAVYGSVLHKGEEILVQWSGRGLAYVDKIRNRRFDLVITKPYESVR